MKMGQTISIDDEIIQIFHNTFPYIVKSEFRWDALQKEYENWDSFAHLRIVQEIEKKFNLTLDVDEITFINSAEGFLTLVKSKLNNNLVLSYNERKTLNDAEISERDIME